MDPRNLPSGSALIEKATASKDRADLMPRAWISRQMREGRVLLIVDGLDETEPQLRDEFVLPWLAALCREFPECGYLVSSRPVGYPAGVLRDLKFVEAELLDFDEPQVLEYTNHWCTAIRLARNEPDAEARREGAADGEMIVAGFKDHPYVRDLARNPLMLSAICLVNYFEHGSLPRDRVLLYKLCVEGLLHHWDQRRGISSEFALQEKLLVSRELALAMQRDDRAEYETNKVQEVFAAALNDPTRAQRLLEHVRYRTGLLVERRPGIFAFAHLTFQEYLAACAIHEGNRLEIGTVDLVQQHDDGRWKEVIALYCGLATAPCTRQMIDGLMAHQDTESLGTVSTDAFLSARPEVSQDADTRHAVLERIAMAPGRSDSVLSRFDPVEVMPIANAALGRIQSDSDVSGAYRWLLRNPESIDSRHIEGWIERWQTLKPVQLGEVSIIVHQAAPDRCLVRLAELPGLYESEGIHLGGAPPYFRYPNQASLAVFGLQSRVSSMTELGLGFEAALQRVLRVGVEGPEWNGESLYSANDLAEKLVKRNWRARGKKSAIELAGLLRRMAERHPGRNRQSNDPFPYDAAQGFMRLADRLASARPKGARKRSAAKSR